MPAVGNEKRVGVILDQEVLNSLPSPRGEPNFSRAGAQLIIVDQAIPLANIISENLCPGWNLRSPEDFCLQFQEPNKQFITERNRAEIQNGNVLTLTFSPEKTTQRILAGLYSARHEEKHPAVKLLSELSVDITFATEYISKNGLLLLTNMIQCESYSGDDRSLTFKSFLDLMYHNIVSWDVLEDSFIKTVSNCVSSHDNQLDTCTLQLALDILESIVLNSTSLHRMVENEITPETLSQHLCSSNVDVQKNALALMNALFMKGDLSKRTKIAEFLRTKRSQTEILQVLLRPDAYQQPEMAHQLYVLQANLFSLLKGQMNTPVDVNSQSVLNDLTDLRKTALSIVTEPTGSRKQNYTKEFKKLGFQNHVNPEQDLVVTPPGVLALKNMVFFAKAHADSYRKVVLENSSREDNHDLPFAKASIELTAMLCDILKIGEEPMDDGLTYYPMFFFHERPFEEFFCHCVQLMSKTWKEMKAKTADLTKVLGVVREQVTRALQLQPQSFDKFRTSLSQLTYLEINKIRETQRQRKEEWEFQAKPIVELMQQLKPEITELVKQQRLNYLVEGTMFTNKIRRLADKKMYCRLSPNYKVLYYGVVEDPNYIPSIEQLSDKLAVVDIKGLLVGNDCPHTKDIRKDTRKQSQHKLAFSIQTDLNTGESVDFIAPDEKHFQLWTDGINALIGNPMESELAKHDVETLLRMEVKLRLLDLEGDDIKIPNSPPPIPRAPADFNFACGAE